MNWPASSLEDLVKISKGKKHKLSDTRTPTRYIQIDDLRNDNLIKYTEDEVGSFVNDSDVIIAWDGANAGTIGYGLNGLIGSTLARLSIVNTEVDAEYLARFLQSKFKEIRNNCTGATIPHVSKSHLVSLQIPLPPLKEQKRIAAILDKAENLLRKRQQASQLADEFLRAVFLDMFGDPVTNPKGWMLEPINNGLLSIVSGWSVKGESYPCEESGIGVLKISAVTSGKFRPFENKRVDPDTIPKNKKLIFPKKGDLLFSRANTRELVAATCIVPEDRGNVFLPDKLWLVKANEDRFLPEFLNYLIWQPRFKDLLTSQATGTSGSMLNISKAKFENTAAIFPPIGLQERFRETYWVTQGILNNINSSKVDIDGMFGSISQKAFSGSL